MLYVHDNFEGVSQTGEFATSVIPSHNVYYGDNSLKRQSTESETSYDSGYFSPLASGRTSMTPGRGTFTPMMHPAPTPTPAPGYTSNVVQQSPSKIAMMASVIDELTSSRPVHNDLPMLDDWDKNFIENFEENLFSLDNCDDMGLLEGLFKSPTKSPLQILSPAKGSRFSPRKTMHHRSPFKNPLYRSPHKFDGQRAGYKGTDHKFGVVEQSHMGMGRSGVQSLNGQRIASKVAPAETMTSHTISPGILAEKRQPGAFVGIPLGSVGGPNPKRMRIDPRACTNSRQLSKRTKENNDYHSSKQKLQMARANFRLSLEKAVETAASRSHFRKSEQYPQLSKALSKPSSTVPTSPTFGVSTETGGASSANPSPTFGNPYLEEDAEIPSSWLGSAGHEVGAYEVEPQAGCKVVIRKRKKSK